MRGTAAVVLAAGAGSRMGRVKPLLPWAGGTLVSHACGVCEAAGCDSVAVVVGHAADAVAAAVPKGCRVVRNEAWDAGPGTSVAAGVRASQDAERIVVVLCDAPRVTSENVASVIRAVGSDVYAAAAVAGQAVGPPACFARPLFPRLLKLRPERGAGSLLCGLGERFAGLAMPAAFDDLDTPADYEAAVDRSSAAKSNGVGSATNA